MLQTVSFDLASLNWHYVCYISSGNPAKSRKLYMHLLFAHFIYFYIILIRVPCMVMYFVLFTFILFACLITISPGVSDSKPCQSVAYLP